MRARIFKSRGCFMPGTFALLPLGIHVQAQVHSAPDWLLGSPSARTLGFGLTVLALHQESKVNPASLSIKTVFQFELAS